MLWLTDLIAIAIIKPIKKSLIFRLNKKVYIDGEITGQFKKNVIVKSIPKSLYILAPTQLSKKNLRDRIPKILIRLVPKFAI